MDYAIAHADEVPSFTTELSEVPSPTHPLGIRPAGEGGTTPALGAVVNAIVDALAEFGVTHVEMPATPERVWRAIHDSRLDRKEANADLVSLREHLSVRAAGGAGCARNSVRGSLPNRYCDPKIAADLFHECLDEHLLCDDLGVNIVSIEHHAGINSLYGASPMILGTIARQTSKVRILSQGTLITVRRDPVRDRGGIRHRRCDLARPAGDRLRQVGRQRDGVRQRQPDGHRRTLLGGDRPDREDSHQP